MPVKLGTNGIGDIFLGESQVKKVYLGTTLKYQSRAAVRSFSTAVSATNTTSVVIDRPNNVVAGDLMLMILHSDGGVTYTAPAGWTSYFTQGSGGGSQDSLEVFYKVATVADETESNYTFTISAGQTFTATMLSLKNAGTAPGGYSSDGDAAAAGSLNSSVSLAHSDNSLSVAFVAHEYPTEDLTDDPASNDGFTEIVDISSSASASIVHQRLHVYTKEIDSAVTQTAEHTMQSLYRRIYGIIEIETD